MKRLYGTLPEQAARRNTDGLERHTFASSVGRGGENPASSDDLPRASGARTLKRAVQVFLEFSSLASMRQQAQCAFERGSVFVPGTWLLAPRARCDLVLVHPESGELFSASAEVASVRIEPNGVVLFLLESTAILCRRLAEFLEEPEAPTASAGLRPSAISEDAESLSVDSPEGAERHEAESVLPPPSRNRSSAARTHGVSIMERVRGLHAGERERMARTGTLEERKALERVYGAAVWTALLANPQLTGPEVARIAKNGAVSQPLLKVIVSSSAWLSKSEVRRALLGNPRLRGPNLERVLRALPRTELLLVPKQTAYPPPVRAAVAKLLGK